MLSRYCFMGVSPPWRMVVSPFTRTGPCEIDRGSGAPVSVPRMAWADEILRERSEPLARAVLPLVLSGPLWRHRRVETLTPVSATTVRRRVSIDLTVPRELHEDLRIGEQWIVPLGWLSRRPLVSFD